MKYTWNSHISMSFRSLPYFFFANRACFKISSVFTLGNSQCLCQLLARLSGPVTSPASKACHCNNNTRGWNSAAAQEIVHCRSKNNYFPYLFLYIHIRWWLSFYSPFILSRSCFYKFFHWFWTELCDLFNYRWHAAAMIARLGSGAYLAKSDIKSAFRLVPVSSTDFDLLGFFL